MNWPVTNFLKTLFYHASFVLGLGFWLIPQSGLALVNGDRVKVVSSIGVKTRETPSTSGVERPPAVPYGQLGTIISSPTSANGYTWWKVNWDSTSYYDGWSAEGTTTEVWLQKVAAAPAPTVTGVTPTSVVGSNSPRTFTVTGSNFVSGAKVFNLAASAPVSSPLVAWKGKVAKTNGAFSGTLTFPAGFSANIPSGSAAVSGVLIQDGSWGSITGCGLIKVPASGAKGSFRTAAIVLDQ